MTSIQAVLNSVFIPASLTIKPSSNVVNVRIFTKIKKATDKSCLCTDLIRHLRTGYGTRKWMLWEPGGAQLASGGAACPPKPVSLALSKLESHLSLVARRSLNPASPRGPFSATLRMPNPLNQRLIPYLNSQLFSWWRSLGRVLARCTKSLASQAKLAMGSVRECPPPLECRGLIKIRSRRGVLQALPQPLPI